MSNLRKRGRKEKAAHTIRVNRHGLQEKQETFHGSNKSVTIFSIPAKQFPGRVCGTDKNGKDVTSVTIKSELYSEAYTTGKVYIFRFDRTSAAIAEIWFILGKNNRDTRSSFTIDTEGTNKQSKPLEYRENDTNLLRQRIASVNPMAQRIYVKVRAATDEIRERIALCPYVDWHSVENAPLPSTGNLEYRKPGEQRKHNKRERADNRSGFRKLPNRKIGKVSNRGKTCRHCNQIGNSPQQSKL